MARPTKAKDVKPDEVSGDAPAAAPSGGSALDIKFILTVVLISIVSVVGSAASVYFLAPMVVGPLIAAEVKGAIKAGQEEAAEGEGEAGAEGEHGGASHDTNMNMELDEFTVNLKPDPSLGGNQFLRTKMSLTVTVPPAEYCDPNGGAHAAASRPQMDRWIASRPLIRQPLSVSWQGIQSQSKSPVVYAPRQSELSGHFNQGVIAGAAANLNTEEPVSVSAPRSSATLNLPVEGQNTPNQNMNVPARSSERLLASGGGPDPFTLCMDTFNKSMAKYVPTMRDIINQSLMKRTAGTLASVEGQELLKDEIKSDINHLMAGKYQVARVNFSDFIIQY